MEILAPQSLDPDISFLWEGHNLNTLQHKARFPELCSPPENCLKEGVYSQYLKVLGSLVSKFSFYLFILISNNTD